MKTFVFYLGLFAFGMMGSIVAQDLDDLFDEEDIETEESVLSSYKGFIETKAYGFAKDRTAGGNEGRLITEAELELSFRLNEQTLFFFRPRVYMDLADNKTRRLDPLEAYLSVDQKSWDFRIGQFVENLGIVDTYNPIDVLNRRDLATDPLDSTRLGELGIRLRKFFDGNDTIGEPGLSLYALPVFQETRFPSENSRFGIGSNITPFESRDEFEPKGSRAGMYALRYTSTLNTNPVNADIQFLAARGPERTPLVVRQPNRFVPLYYEVDTLGTGFRAVPNEAVLGNQLAHITFKGEITYKKPHLYSHTPLTHLDSYLSFVFGMDREFNGVFAPQDALTVMVEYAGEDGASRRDLAAAFRPFQDDLILRLFWEANDFARKSFEIRGIHDLENQEMIVESIFSTQLRFIHDDLKLTLSYQYFDSPKDGFYPVKPDNSNGVVALRWDF